MGFSGLASKTRTSPLSISSTSFRPAAKTDPDPARSNDHRTFPELASMQRKSGPDSWRPWNPYKKPFTNTGVAKWDESD